MAKEHKIKITTDDTVKKLKKDLKGLRSEVGRLKKENDKLARSADNVTKKNGKFRLTTKGLQKQIGILRNQILLVTFAFGGLAVAIKKSTEAAKKQFIAEAKLIGSLSNVASASEGGATELIKYASELQKVTTFSDENIISGMAMLGTFQLNETQIKAITPRMLDMATATSTAALEGGDLSAIALQLGKAFTGQVSSLTRSGVLIDKTAHKMALAKGSTEEFNFILDELDRNFKGMAEQIAKSPVGALLQMENKIDDNVEAIGTRMIPIQASWTEKMVWTSHKAAEMTIIFEELWKHGLNLADGFAAAKKAQDKFNESLKSRIEQLKILKTLERENTEFLQDAEINYLQDKLHLMKNGLSLEEQILLIDHKKISVTEALRKSNPAITEFEAKKQIFQLDIKRLAIEEQIATAKKRSVSSAIGNLANLNDAVKGSAKVSARLTQASAIIDMYAGANKAFAQGGVLGFATAAAIIAAGTANLLEISRSVGDMNAFAMGGDFITSGPQMIMVGDNPGGRERVQVTPMSSPNINGPQGGGTTIIIQGGIIQEDYVRNELIPALNKATSLGARINA